MSVVLRCGTIVPGCAVFLRGQSEDDVLIAMFDHLKATHNLNHVPVDLRQKLKAAVEPESPTGRVRAVS